MNKKYNVYIVSIKNRQAEAKIGEEMTESQAEKRVLTGLSRIDRENYFVGDYEVGSEPDLKFAEDIKNNN